MILSATNNRGTMMAGAGKMMILTAEKLISLLLWILIRQSLRLVRFVWLFVR